MYFTEGIVFMDAAGEKRQSAAFSDICELEGGRWLCTFRTAPRKKETAGQNTAICWSDDQGTTWQGPVHPFAPMVIGNTPGLFRSGYPTPLPDGRLLMALCWVDHSDPKLPFYNEETEGLLDTRVFTSVSDDGGENWSIPAYLDTGSFTDPTPLTGSVLINPQTNAWVLQFEVNKHYWEESPWVHSSVLMFSQDNGRSWPEYSVVSRNPEIFYWDQRPGFLRNGDLLNLFWTYDTVQTIYLNIHARRSSDGGRTWGPFMDTGVPGQPAPPVDLGDGLLAMVYMDRTAVPSLKLRFSRDGGQSWHGEQLLYRHDRTAAQQYRKHSMNDAWAEMGKFSVGLPRTALTRSGDLLITFYAGETTDHTGVRWICIPQDELKKER